MNWRWGSRLLAGVFLPLALAACGRIIPPPETPPAPPATPILPQANAATLGLRAGPAISGLGLHPENAVAALASFRLSCPRLTSRSDASGLTRGDDWKPACSSAANWPMSDAPAFFDHHFETARVGSGQSLVTGYFEPEIAGVRSRQPGFDVPVLGLPPDLTRGWPDDVPPSERTGTPPLGRIAEGGRFVPYHDRAAIEDGALAGRGLEIAWAVDPVEFFFLQVQGSGRLRAPDGSVMRIGYAGTNGQPYAGIGSIMRTRGLLGEGPGKYPGSMQGIMRYLREHPEDGRALMRENRSWVFFRELTAPDNGLGPPGALGVPVRERITLAADPLYVPLGAPVWLTVDRSEANGLWIAQDTGGAIKGANRFDSFWGSGEAARTIAGGMNARGSALVMLPKGTLSRLGIR